MGSCLNTVKETHQTAKLSSHDYHLIWSRCLKPQGESPWPVPRG